MTDPFKVQTDNNATILALKGDWRITNAEQLRNSIETTQSVTGQAMIDGAGLSTLDTAGAYYILSLSKRYNAHSLQNFSPSQRQLIELVNDRLVEFKTREATKELNFLQRIGRQSEAILARLVILIIFLGETFCAAITLFKQPKLFRVRELFVQLERVLLGAIGIVALVTALIGVVVAYLFAIQLVKYGANIFIVDGITLAMCRELSPLIVAIIMAGRSGSAFTAQIGTMKLNEEIDAMTTLGLSPQQVLVLPRIIALVIAMPLLAFVGNIIGIIGGMFIVYQYADITPATFIQRIYTHFPIASFYIGLAKAPVYAFFIALIGCALGFNVENNARSVGENTTRTVVYSIVLVIILNAGFAVLFAHVGFPGSKR